MITTRCYPTASVNALPCKIGSARTGASPRREVHPIRKRRPLATALSLVPSHTHQTVTVLSLRSRSIGTVTQQGVGLLYILNNWLAQALLRGVATDHPVVLRVKIAQ